ncbi:MAG TPA: apolipoprotein N-acyltransferase [Actinomycetota bacterium]|nr:apolipoprotein N-acyltransferase [Actinomycetota bacterium]
MTTRARPSLALGCGISLATGLITSLAFPPFGLWPVAFVGLVPLLLILQRRTAPVGALLGLCFGIGLYGASLYWVLLFGELAWVALIILSATSVAVFGFLACHVTRPDRVLVDALALAALWTVLDWIRGVWPLGGLTWTALGISQVSNRSLLPLASVTAVWGVTFVVVFANAALAGILTRQGSGVRRSALAIAAAAAVTAPALLPGATPQGPTQTLAVVQIDVRVPENTSTVAEDLIVARRNVELHRSLAGNDPKPDLIVWGEGALDPASLQDPATVAAVEEVIAAVGVATTIGAVVNDPDGSQHTSVLAFDAAGRLVDRYDKTHLVPFGEYVPWRRRLQWLDVIDQIPVDRVAGEGSHPIEQPPVPAYGTPICFENSFPAITRAFVDQGAEFIVVPVNNASYLFTAAAEQHLQMSQMRAVETGRWVVDAGVAGISAFIDPTGAVVSRTALFEPGILRGQVRASTAQTAYVRFGDWLPALCGLIVVMSLLTPRRRSQTRPAPGPLPAPLRALAIMPTYDERDTIELAIRGVLAIAGVDVLVVDDASPDGTGDIVRAIAAEEPRVRLLERAAKSGLASAYLAGFQVALADGYDVAIEMDSDLSHDPEELPSLIAAAQRHDLVVGSRYIPGGAVTDWSRSRVALSRGGNAYARFMLGLPIHDATSGYRVYRRVLLDALLRRPFAADGYGFQIELVMRSHRLGFDVGESPITFRDRQFGESKISRGIVVEALWMVTRWGAELRFRTRPRI